MQSSSADIATASVKLAFDDEVHAEAATGNGPVDAVYDALNRITQFPIQLEKYQLTAKGHGRNALGQVDIVVEYDGRRFHGVGLATDIIEFSALEMVNAMNTIWRARQVGIELQRLHQHNNSQDMQETV